MVSEPHHGALADEVYAPYAIVRDPAVLDLSPGVFDSAFGDMHIVRTVSRADHGTLFLHGVGGAWSSWSPLIQAARAGKIDLGDCCFMDLPGFGASQNTRPDLPADLVSDELFRLAAKLGWTSFRLVGHSMGGFLALHAASAPSTSQLPELRSLVVASGTYLSVVDAVQRGWRAWFDSAGVAVTFETMRVLAKLGPAAPVILDALRKGRILPLALARTLAHSDRVDPTFYVEMVNGLRPQSFLQAAENGHDYDALARWAAIGVPTLLVSGTKDNLVPVADAQRAQAVIDGSELALFKECGHFAPIEHPGLLASLVAARISE